MEQPSSPSVRTEPEGGASSGNAAPDAILSIINSEFPAATSGVIQNAGATVSEGTNSFVSPFVQSTALGASAAGHAVVTQARETSTPNGSISGGAAITTFGFSNLFNGNAAFPVPLFSSPPANVGAGPAQSSAMSATTLLGVSPPTSQPIVPALYLATTVLRRVLRRRMTVERRLKTSQDSVVSQIQKFGSKIFSVLGVSGSRCFESKEPKNVFKFCLSRKPKNQFKNVN